MQKPRRLHRQYSETVCVHWIYADKKGCSKISTRADTRPDRGMGGEMSAVCTCRNADIDKSNPANPFCRKCGAWWIPKYGSTEPDMESRCAEKIAKTRNQLKAERRKRREESK